MKKGIELPSLFWRNIEGYEGLYQVSIDGEVKSLERISPQGHLLKERIMKPVLNDMGYLRVGLTKGGKSKSFFVHRLVAQAWIPNPDNLPIINHKDENPLNNRVENLEWCTQKYNVNYGTAIEKRKKPVVGINPVTGEVVVEFSSTAEAGRNGYRMGCILDCCKGKSLTCKGLIWCYKGTSNEEINRRIAEYRHNEEITKPVVALDKQGRIVHTFSNVGEAEKHGYDQRWVSACCNGMRKSHKKLIWKYQDDFLEKVCLK